MISDILNEVLEEARAKVSRNWVPWEERFSGFRPGEMTTLDVKMAKPIPEERPPAYSSRTGRPLSVMAQSGLPTRDYRPKRVECEDPRGHAWVSNGTNKTGRRREKCRWCKATRFAELELRPTGHPRKAQNILA